MILHSTKPQNQIHIDDVYMYIYIYIYCAVAKIQFNTL